MIFGVSALAVGALAHTGAFAALGSIISSVLVAAGPFLSAILATIGAFLATPAAPVILAAILGGVVMTIAAIVIRSLVIKGSNVVEAMRDPEKKTENAKILRELAVKGEIEKIEGLEGEACRFIQLRPSFR